MPPSPHVLARLPRGEGQGFHPDPAVRRAVEAYAMRRAQEYFVGTGWSVEDVSRSRPYDLHCHRRGEELKVEVKGTTSAGSVVILTRAEVEHARANANRCALFIVGGIVANFLPGLAEPLLSGGDFRLLHPWEPSPEDLTVIGFSYSAPNAGKGQAKAGGVDL